MTVSRLIAIEDTAPTSSQLRDVAMETANRSWWVSTQLDEIAMMVNRVLRLDYHPAADSGAGAIVSSKWMRDHLAEVRQTIDQVRSGLSLLEERWSDVLMAAAHLDQTSDAFQDAAVHARHLAHLNTSQVGVRRINVIEAGALTLAAYPNDGESDAARLLKYARDQGR